MIDPSLIVSRAGREAVDRLFSNGREEMYFVPSTFIERVYRIRLQDMRWIRFFIGSGQTENMREVSAWVRQRPFHRYDVPDDVSEPIKRIQGPLQEIVKDELIASILFEEYCFLQTRSSQRTPFRLDTDIVVDRFVVVGPVKSVDYRENVG